MKISRSWILSFFLFCSSTTLLATELHVCTVATYDNPFLKNFFESCKRYGISVDLLGWGKGYYSHGFALQLIDHYINTLPDEDLVLVVDSFDLFFLAGPEEIVQRFEELGGSFLISAERNCAPDGQLKLLYPSSPTPYRFVNTGTYMSSVQALKTVLKRVAHPIDPFQNDQRILTLDFLANQSDYFLDRNAQVIQTLYEEERDHFFLDPYSMKMKNLVTGTFPCIVHGNGYSPLLDPFYAEFFQNNPHCPEASGATIHYIDDLALLMGLLEKDPVNLSLLLDLADLYFISKEYEKAKAQYLLILEQFDLNHDIKYWCTYQIANSHSFLGASIEEIIALYLKAYNINPSHAEPLSKLAKIYLGKNLFQEAYEVLKVGMELHDQPFGYYYEDSVYRLMPVDFALAAYFSGHFAEVKKSAEKILNTSMLPSHLYPWAEDMIRWANSQLKGKE